MKALQEYTREFCPIWGHKGWCGRREDGLVLCKRPPTPPKASGYTFKGMARDGQTGMFVEIGRELRRGNRTIRRPPVHANITSGAGASPDVRPSLETRFTSSEGAFTPERRAVLAQELGLPEPALDELKIGWSDTASHHDDRTIAGAWVFPEFDGQGRMIGASYRFPQAALDGKTGPDGKPLGCKSSPAGLQRGLTLPLGWREMPDPILVAEGASDVLAGRAVGLSVIGRPSNTGGAGYVAQACRQRRVIILGENDRKSDGRWPGKEGAELIQRKLEAIWDRPVPVAFPSEGIKDLRDWVTQIVSDWSADLSGIRNSILEAVNPPKLLLLAKPQRRGRPVVEIFAWSGGAEAQPLHSDRVDTKEAPARRRFVQAVSKIKPNVDVDDLTRRLLLLKVAPEVAQDVTRAPADNTAVGSWQSGDGQLPTVFLPGGPTRITESAEELGGLLARAGEYFVRGGAVMTVGRDDDALTVLEALKPASLASAFEKVFKLGTYIRSGAGFTPVEAICREQDAKLIQNCRTFRQALPPIRILSRCPVLVEKDGKLIQASEYDRDSGILAFGDPVPEVGLTQAVTLLHGMLADFRFATDSDRARALAAVITPALIFGGLLNGRAPIGLGEADQSQTGKGYRNKLTAGTYCCKVKTVTQRKGGVGSLEESFASALIKGYNFIALDNVRGTIDSPAIEFFLTEDSFLARIPYLAAVEIDPRRVILQLTSNRADITVDLANRSSCVRILKQPEGRLFRQYPGGDVLDHVQAHQPLYLGAVFAVVRAWHEAGKPTTKETRHDFRPWARTLDWIVQEIFQAGPLLDGHRETQARIATPVLNWLRDVALAVRQAGRLDIPIRASEILDIISENPDVNVPGLTERDDLSDKSVREKVLRALGRKLSLCFKPGDMITIDDMRVERTVEQDAQNRDIRSYRFVAEPPVPPYPAIPSVPICVETAVSAIPRHSPHQFLNGVRRAQIPLEPAKERVESCTSATDIMSGTMRGMREDGGNQHFKPFCGNGRPDSMAEDGGNRRAGRFELRVRAEELVKGRPDADELLYIFDEREAIAFLDGGLDDQAAAQMAYEQFLRELAECAARQR